MIQAKWFKSFRAACQLEQIPYQVKLDTFMRPRAHSSHAPLIEASSASSQNLRNLQMALLLGDIQGALAVLVLGQWVEHRVVQHRLDRGKAIRVGGEVRG